MEELILFNTAFFDALYQRKVTKWHCDSFLYFWVCQEFCVNFLEIFVVFFH